MKKRIKITYLSAFILLSLGVASCDDEPLQGKFADELEIESDTDNSSNYQDSFIAFLDGEEYLETTIETEVVTPAEDPQYIKITAIMSADDQLNISIPTAFGVGEYDFGNSILTGTNARGYYLSASEVKTSNGGTLVITEKTASRIKGTFQFTAKNPSGDVVISVTEGDFDVAY